MKWLDKYQDGGVVKNNFISLPKNEDYVTAYANSKGLDNEQLSGFEAQDVSDESWRKSRDDYYSNYRQDWMKKNNNSNLSQANPEYMNMISQMKSSWFDQNQRPINDVVQDYSVNGPAKPNHKFGENLQLNASNNFQHGGTINKEASAKRWKEIQSEISTKKYNKKAEKENQAMYDASMHQAKKEDAKEYVKNNWAEVNNHPLWQAPGMIGGMGLEDIALKGLGKGAQMVAKSPIGKQLAGKATKFVSEINWGNWNKEIPQNKSLMKEYSAIEKQSKSKDTWMTNSNGSPFKGTPEQFVQTQSKNFKKAYPNGYDVTYRGDLLHNPELRSKSHNFYDQPIFTANEELASSYSNKRMNQYYNANTPTLEENFITFRNENLKDKNITYKEYLNKNPSNAFKSSLSPTGGTHELVIPKSNNNIVMDAGGQEWHSLNDNVLQKQMIESNTQSSGGRLSFTTDQVAKHIYNKNIDRADIFNVDDGGLGNVIIHNQQSGKYAKSFRGNNGNFDMFDKNVYKAVVPGAIGVGTAMSQSDNQSDVSQMQHGGVIDSQRGQWDYPGEVTRIQGNDITMQGVDYPVLGISDTGDQQMMYPGEEYKFKGNSVTEFPLAKNGVATKNKNKSTNFTTPNWLDKFAQS